MSEKLKIIAGSDNVFRDMGFPWVEAHNFQLPADLMIAVERYVKKSEPLQSQAAKRLGITQPRLNDFLRHRIEKFSLDSLVNLATRAALNVRLTVRQAA